MQHITADQRPNRSIFYAHTVTQRVSQQSHPGLLQRLHSVFGVYCELPQMCVTKARPPSLSVDVSPQMVNVLTVR